MEIAGFAVLWYLLVGHALGDFVLQSDAMAKGKNRHRNEQPAGAFSYYPRWGYWLGAHALVHGGIVSLVTGSVALGMAETLAHALIDFGKNENWYGIDVDQVLHVLCKFAWLGVLAI